MSKRLRTSLEWKDGESIVTAYAKPCAGPGWSNMPIWVVIRNREGVMREACIQPEQQSAGMHLLYRISSAINSEMTYEVEREITGRKV